MEIYYQKHQRKIENIAKKIDNINMEEKIQYFRSGAMKGPLRLHLAGSSVCDNSYDISREPPQITVFEAVTSGYGTLEVDGHRFHPTAGDVYIAPGWLPHRYGCREVSDPWHKTWMNVSGPLVEHLLKAYKIDHVFLFRNAAEANRILCETVAALETVSEEDRETFCAEAIFRLIRALGEHHARENVRLAGGDEPDSPAEQIRLFLRKKIMEPMPSLEDIAKVIRRSPVQAIRIFKGETGMTPYDFLLREKIDAAAELLRNSRKSVKEIAFMLGFHDEYYFSRLFKRKRGVSPKRFRQG